MVSSTFLATTQKVGSSNLSGRTIFFSYITITSAFVSTLKLRYTRGTRSATVLRNSTSCLERCVATGDSLVAVTNPEQVGTRCSLSRKSTYLPLQCRTRCTVFTEQPRLLAMARRPSPSLCIRSISASFRTTEILPSERPNLLPALRARIKPALVRSEIAIRSCWASVARIERIDPASRTAERQTCVDWPKASSGQMPAGFACQIRLLYPRTRARCPNPVSWRIHEAYTLGASLASET